MAYRHPSRNCCSSGVIYGKIQRHRREELQPSTSMTSNPAFYIKSDTLVWQFLPDVVFFLQDLAPRPSMVTQRQRIPILTSSPSLGASEREPTTDTFSKDTLLGHQLGTTEQGTINLASLQNEWSVTSCNPTLTHLGTDDEHNWWSTTSRQLKIPSQSQICRNTHPTGGI